MKLTNHRESKLINHISNIKFLDAYVIKLRILNEAFEAIKKNNLALYRKCLKNMQRIFTEDYFQKIIFSDK